MKLIFASNYLSHYSRSISEAFIRIYGDDFKFVAFTPFNEKRLSAGFHDMNDAPFVLRAYESPQSMNEAMNAINEAECVIIGGMPVSCVSERLKRGKITFMQSERFFKGPLWKDIVRFAKYCLYSGGRSQAKDAGEKFYLLCAGAFTAWDYNLCGLFRGKAYRWGYFPELKKYDDIGGLISRKKPGSILWAGRFLGWKHPELSVRLAKNLKAMNFDFHVKIVGSGEMQGSLSRMIEAENLNDCVELTGALPTERVREEMESSQVFLFTSGRGEGWGVVLNEAMNSGCSVVAGGKIGAVPYLLKEGYNGLVFRDRDIDDLTAKVAGLFRDSGSASRLGLNAYETLAGMWSPETAARRFVVLADALKVSDGAVRLWDDGPGSLAPVI
ncbi:MAG: glycosyltransferase family 4 protein [Synergistaceae bacterium]|nr:glycosyltransferase family 4 protein [Synergistaceae bacterium]